MLLQLYWWSAVWVPFSPSHPGAKAAPCVILSYSVHFISVALDLCWFLSSFVCSSQWSQWLSLVFSTQLCDVSQSVSNQKNTQGWCDLLGCCWHGRSPDHLIPLSHFVHSGASVLSFETSKQPLGRLPKLCREPAPHHSSLPSSLNQTLLESSCRLPSTPIRKAEVFTVRNTSLPLAPSFHSSLLSFLV